jgi:hypothetical protein
VHIANCQYGRYLCRVEQPIPQHDGT